ncbi:MAG: cupin domain-containing protein [Betaproteobacteria bacterium]|nr:cupin domain-containing protein [Betaproteobacteria bacterium]MCC6248312.1 cupin domain-containing protein [Rubrivivax sp.]
MAQPHARPGVPFSVAALAGGEGGGRTTALIKGRQVEVVHLVLPAGKRLREHSAPGEVTVYVLAGEVDFGVPGAVHRLRAGDFIHLDAGEPHSLLAISDFSALVTIALGAPG